MSKFSRDLLILLKDQQMDQNAIDQEIEKLNEILLSTESPEQYCIVHELVDRNRITSKAKKILNVSKYSELKPFRFLVCKN